MLFVVNLDVSVTASDLYDHFCNVDDLTLIWDEVSKDHETGKSLRYGHICFYSHQHGMFILSSLLFTAYFFDLV